MERHGGRGEPPKPLLYSVLFVQIYVPGEDGGVVVLPFGWQQKNLHCQFNIYVKGGAAMAGQW